MLLQIYQPQLLQVPVIASPFRWTKGALTALAQMTNQTALYVPVHRMSIAGIVDAPTLFRGTPYAVMGVFILAALLTPPDWVSQIFLGIPMVLLYLLGVAVAYVFGGKKARGSTTKVASSKIEADTP